MQFLTLKKKNRFEERKTACSIDPHQMFVVSTLTVDQFLAVSSIVRYGFLGVLLLLTLLFAKLHRSRQRQALEQVAEQQTQETSHTPV